MPPWFPMAGADVPPGMFPCIILEPFCKLAGMEARAILPIFLAAVAPRPCISKNVINRREKISHTTYLPSLGW